MKTLKRFTMGAGPVRNVLIWSVLFLLCAFGTSQAAVSKPPQITAKLQVASNLTSAHVPKHQRTFQLVGMDNAVYKPLSVVPTKGGQVATFRLPNKPGLHPFSNIAPNFYRVLAYDSGYLTGVSAIMVSYDPNGAGRTWSFPVDTRQSLLLGTYVLKLAATLSGASDTVLYHRLAQTWLMPIFEANPGPDYSRVAEKAGNYTLKHPVTSPRKAAQAILALLPPLGAETAGAGGAAAVPQDVAMDAMSTAADGKPGEKIATAANANVITTCGNFAAAVVGEIPGVGPFLGAAVSSIFSAIAGEQTVSVTEFDQFVGQVEYQIGQLQTEMYIGQTDFKNFVLQTDFDNAKTNFDNVFTNMKAIHTAYNAQFLNTICDPAYGVTCVPAPSNGPYIPANWQSLQNALATNSTLRHTLENFLSGATLSMIYSNLNGYVPRVAQPAIAESDDPLFVLNNGLRQDMQNLTNLNGPFPSILQVFAEYDEFYASAGLGVALMFDQAAQMVAMAQYLYDKYSTVNGGPDSFTPAGLPSQNQGWANYCQTNYQAPGGSHPWQYLPYCMAQEFNYSNAQQWLFMSTLNLTGGCPPAWQSNSLFTSVGSTYTENCPWIVLPVSNPNSTTAGFPWLNGGGNGGPGGSCVVNDWNATGTWFFATCNNYSGAPTYSTFQYNGCIPGSLDVWSGYLFCDNTAGSNTTGNFNWSDDIQTPSSDSVDIQVLFNTPGGGGGAVYLWTCSNTHIGCGGLSMGPTSWGPNGTYTDSLTLNPTGNDSNNFIALLKDTSNYGYVFNLIYNNNNNTVSLACPKLAFGGYSAVYSGPTPPTPNDLINQNYFTTPLCQPGTPPSWTLCSTSPKAKDNQGYCTGILMNNQVWYRLFQAVNNSATSIWQQSAQLESFGN